MRRALPGLVTVLAASLAGCSDAVKATPYEASDSPECLAVAEHWPSTVGGQAERVTAVQSQGVAAWGDPAVIALCGATSPGPTTLPCYDVSGVDWVLTQELQDGAAFVTYGRSPAIEVLVPDAYAPEPLVLAAFGQAASALEQTRHCS